MKHHLRRISTVAVAAALVLAAADAQAQRRPITEQDLFRFVWVADPQIAPDGSQVAFVRVTIAEKKDDDATQVWIAPSDGKAAPLRRGLNLTLATQAGDLDLLGEVTGGGGFNELRARAIAVRLFDRDVLCLELDALIRIKRAAGRPKDLEAVAEREALRDERG